MESLKGRELLEQTLVKRHGRKKAVLLIENLSQDGLLEDILAILEKIGLIEQLFERYSELAPEIITKYKASRDAIHQRLLQLLDYMIKDPFYNRKILGNRAVLLSGSIRRYREKILAIIELLENVLIDIKKDLLIVLKSRAKKVHPKLEEVMRLISELSVEEDYLASIEKGTHIINRIESSLHLNAVELIDNLEELKRVDSELLEIKMQLQSSLDLLRRMEELLSEDKSLLKRIEEIYASISQMGIETPFIKKLIDRNIFPLQSIEKKEEKIHINGIKEKIAALEVIKKELLEHLEIASQINAFANRLKKAEKELPKVLRTCLIVDSMTKKRTFETIYYDIAKRLYSIRQQHTVDSEDQFMKNNDELKAIEDLIAKILTIGTLVRDISRTNDKLKSLAKVDDWKEEIECIISSETSINAVKIVLSYLKDISDKLEIWRQKFRDAEKMYPIWKKRVIRELSTKKEADVKQITSIPREWREWVISKMIKDGMLIERAGLLFLREKPPENQKTIKEELRDRVLRMKKKIDAIYQLPSLEAREKVILKGIIMKLEDIEDRIDLMQGETDLVKIRKEIDNLEGLLETFLVHVKGGVPD